MANITKTKTGKFKITVYDKYGKRYRHTFSDMAGAKAFIAKIEADKYKNKLVKLDLIEADHSFDTAIAEFVESKEGLRKKSIQKYNSVVNEFKNFISMLKITNLNEFNRSHADIFRRKLVDSGAKPKTINFYLNTVNSIFTDQVNKDRLVKNPFSHIKRIRESVKTLTERKEEYYTEKELVKFFKEAKKSPYYYTFVGLFLTGCRFEELSSLQWDKIDFDNKIIKIRSDDQFTTKTASSERDIPISNYLFGILLELKKSTMSKYVFPSINNKKSNERTLLSKCKKIAEKAEINKNATLHKFRHTFTSFLAQKKISEEIRQYLLGHKSQSMTGHYTKIDAGKFHAEINLLDTIFNKLGDNETKNN